jgi:hypothetical protein
MRPFLPLVTLLLAAALAPFPGATARASCVGPQLAVAGQRSATPEGRPGQGEPAVLRASVVTVEGRYFADGCDDTGGQTTGFGCAHQTRPQDRVAPMKEVQLVLRQGGREWSLGTADASARGRIAWRVRIPADLEPGRARLLAATSRTAVVVVIPRR